ncbi:hypothetical protein JCM14036_25270 [Desulfotomaculum defluvii]
MLPQENSSNEFGYHRKQELKGAGFAEKDHLLSSDLSEFNQVSEEFFTELPYCELINASMVEYNEYLNRQRPKGVVPFEEREFRQIEEKMVLDINLKILQEQQVAIPAPAPTPCVPLAESGGSGQFTFQHFLGNQAGCFGIAFASVGSLHLKITLNGSTFLETYLFGATSFSAGSLEYDPNTDPQNITVDIDASEGSIWTLAISCPGPCPDDSGFAVNPLVAEEIETKFGSKTIRIAKVTSAVK